MSGLNNKKSSITKAGREHTTLALDNEKAGKLCWIQHPFITKYINQQISGHSEMDWLTWFKSNYVQTRFEYGLSLGCGTGLVERDACHKNICLKFDGMDITKESIDIAVQKATENNLLNRLNYTLQDLNQIHLETEKYDFVLISHALHHIEKLEYVLKQINKSLKPNGLMLLSEYIGPSQFQFTEEQLMRMNELLEIIPKEYKKDLSKEDKIEYKGPIIRPTREFMNQVDPSEAIRSDEIIPVLNQYFQILVKKDYGGTILQFLLANIAGNFDENKKSDRIWLERFCKLEQQWIRDGRLNSDFAVIVAGHKKSKSIFKKIFNK